MIGKMLSHYRITEKLGAGGMGVVYKARDTHLDRFVALKVLPPQKTLDADRKRRFVQEAKAASALNHPHIIHIYDIANAEGVDFIAMEYVAGETLDRIIGRKGLKINTALGYAVQIADALAKAHGAGIVHRDLKPANIMVNEDDTVKVLDFGLAKLVESEDRDPSATAETAAVEEEDHTERGVILGTVAYMSPEQARGMPVDSRSDIFAFGAVLYEMLSGERAFQGVSRTITLASILEKEPRPLGEFHKQIPPEVERVLARCLRKDPQRRWQSMSDLKEVLQDLKEESESGKLTAGGAAVPARRRSLWMPMAAAILVIALGAGFAWWLLRTSPVPGELSLTRFTFDSGFTMGTAISADGKLIAFSSDRNDEGNADIYVQQINGREAHRLTRHESDDITANFSSDGTKVVFHSSRDGGGLYLLDTLGSEMEGQIQKISGSGWAPMFTPDDASILYTMMPPGSNVLLNKMYLISPKGGRPRPFQPEFGVRPMFGGKPAPVFSPDGKFVLFYGVRAGDPASSDWWVAPLAGGDAVRTGAIKALGMREGVEWNYPTGWFSGQVIFSAGTTTAEGASIYSVPITPGDWKVTGPIRRLTSGPGLNFALPPARDGRMLITNAKAVGELWSLPIDPSRGTLSGPPQRITAEESSKQQPVISRNGARMAYVTARSGPPVKVEMRTRSFPDSRETTLPVRGSSLYLFPRFSEDGSTLAYQDLIEGKWQSFLVREGIMPGRTICDGCTVRAFFSSSNEAVVQYGAELVRQNLETGSRASILEVDSGRMADADLSPNDRWVVYVHILASGRNAIRVAPAAASPGSPPVPVLVAEEDFVLDAPRWSADGKLIYFVSEKDGRPCIWAQPVDPQTGKVSGNALEIFHERLARYGLAGPLRWRTISVARDRIVALRCESTANIYLSQFR